MKNKDILITDTSFGLIIEFSYGHREIFPLQKGSNIVRHLYKI